MNYNLDEVENIKAIYSAIKDKITSRLNEFKQIWCNGSDLDLFTELVFCILTPQSKAKNCWQAVLNLKNKNLLLSDDNVSISNAINLARFKNKKALYIIEARNKLTENGKIIIKSILKRFNSNIESRLWLVNNIKGYGYKEASHFLRNIGLGENIAILDRHILKNLNLLGVIKKIPENLSKNNYLEIENNMQEFSKYINIDMQHLDFILWYKEAHDVFK